MKPNEGGSAPDEQPENAPHGAKGGAAETKGPGVAAAATGDDQMLDDVEKTPRAEAATAEDEGMTINLRDKPFTLDDYKPQDDDEDYSANATESFEEDDRETGQTARESAPVRAVQPARQRKGGFFPMLMGGVAAAAIGAGGVIYGLPQIAPYLPENLRPAGSSFDPAPLQAALDAQAAKIAALAAAPVAPAEVDLSSVEGQLAALTTTLATLDERIVALEKRPVEGGAASVTAVEAFERELADMRALIEKNRSSADLVQEEVAAAAAEVAERIAAAEAEAAAVRAEAQAAAEKALAQAAIARMRLAMDNGAPLVEALAELNAAGLDVPEALNATVPTLAALREGFAPAARAALITARKDTAGEEPLDRLGAFLLAQTGARSLEVREGDTADAVLSRAEAALNAGDVPGALAEVDALPEAAKTAMTDWIAQAGARVAATDALAALAQSLN